MTRPSIALFAVALVAAALGWTGWFLHARHGDEVVRAWMHKNGYFSDETVKLCPPDRILEFKLGDKSFFIPWRWARMEADLPRLLWVDNNATCPSQPINWGGFFMRFPAEVARERNLNIWIMAFSVFREGKRFNEGPIPSNPAARTTYENGGYIEDVTAQWIAARGEDVRLASERVGRSPEETQEAVKKMVAHFRPMDRYYRLQHPRNTDGTEIAPVLMRCNGDPKVVPGRMCIATYPYEGLAIEYRFWPKNGFPNNNSDEKLHLPPAPSEPEELLAADARVRKWIDDLQRRP